MKTESIPFIGTVDAELVKVSKLTKNPTDKDRLNRVFVELRKHGFVAKQKFSCCQSCAWCDLPDAEKAPNVVFYHKQDADAIKGDKLAGTLWIAHRFADASHGWLVCATFSKHGFFVKWDGSEDTRIAVKN